MKGVLLVNLGTPQSPEPKDVGPFLKQFLMDPLVIDIPALARWILVNLLIVPRRAKASSLLYKKVWGPKGSPLLYHTQELGAKVREQLGEKVPLEIGMRYGSPSLGEAISRLRAKGVTEFIVFPLYPQYSLAATESSVGEVKRILGGTPATFVPAFYQHPAYLNAVKEVSAPYLQKNHFDMVVFSYHGLPERQVKKIDPSGAHCLQIEGCCEQATAANRMCYRHHCYETTRALSARLQLNPLRTVLGFQSRLGAPPGLSPTPMNIIEHCPAAELRELRCCALRLSPIVWRHSRKWRFEAERNFGSMGAKNWSSFRR